VARDAKVKQLVLAHHDPSHSDDFLRGVLAQAREKFDNVVIAQEGLAIPL
jgi:ribonuclease BN (tRNA processing enzyme)